MNNNLHSIQFVFPYLEELFFVANAVKGKRGTLDKSYRAIVYSEKEQSYYVIWLDDYSYHLYGFEVVWNSCKLIDEDKFKNGRYNYYVVDSDIKKFEENFIKKWIDSNPRVANNVFGTHAIYETIKHKYPNGLISVDGVEYG